jgi:DNA invertase Pin-like site-specific DNA recombinase
MNSTAIGYVRVSTEDQGESGLGLEAQRTAIKAACESRGWPLLTIHEDILSGKSMKRPGITAALATIRAGGANVLVVSKLDRLSRSLVDFAHLLENAQAEGWTLVALDLGVDLTTPAGEFVANLLVNVAQWERRIISVRIREALAVKKAQGSQLGRTKRVDGALMSRIVTMNALGLGFSAIARELNNEGVPTSQGGKRWYPSTIRSVLRRYYSPNLSEIKKGE